MNRSQKFWKQKSKRVKKINQLRSYSTINGLGEWCLSYTPALSHYFFGLNFTSICLHPQKKAQKNRSAANRTIQTVQKKTIILGLYNYLLILSREIRGLGIFCKKTVKSALPIKGLEFCS